MTEHDELHQGMAPEDVYGHLSAYHQLRALLAPWEVAHGNGLLEWATAYLERHQVDTENLTQQQVESTALHMWDHETGTKSPAPTQAQQRHGLLEVLELAGNNIRQLTAELRERDLRIASLTQRAVSDSAELGEAVAERDALRRRQELADQYAGPHSALEWGYGPVDGVVVPCIAEGQARDNAVDEGGHVWFRPPNPNRWTLSTSDSGQDVP